MQGELKVGSVIPKWKFSSKPRLLQVDSILDVVTALGSRNIRLHAPVQKLPLLALGGWRVAKRIAAGVVVDLVFANVRIDRQQACGR